jgi:hypothetical protein
MFACSTYQLPCTYNALTCIKRINVDSFNSSGCFKLISPALPGRHTEASDLPTIIELSVNFRVRKLCVELNVIYLYTVLITLRFVTSVSFIVHLATSPYSESEQSRVAIVIVNRLLTFSLTFNLQPDHLCHILKETSAQSHVAVLFSCTKTSMTILLQQEGFNCYPIGPIFKAALEMWPKVTPKCR